MHPARPETLVFAYGSNLDPARMRARIPSARPLGATVLPGHRLRFHLRGTLDGTAKADAVSTGDPRHRLPGVVYALAPGSLPILDRIETGYTRLRHWLRIPGAFRGGPSRAESLGRPGHRPVWSYHGAPEGIDDTLLPAPWYLGHVRRGARLHRLPTAHLEALAAQPTLPPRGTGGPA